MAKLVSVLAIALCFLANGSVLGLTFSTKLIHRYSLEAAVAAEPRSRGGGVLPERKSLEYAEVLLSSDAKRQRMKFGSRSQFLFPSEGSSIRSFGNELDWLHYTWIDVGNPNVSFLVALDVGSDFFWVPCECIRCASFSASQYTVLDRDLSEYQPSKSNTVKNMSCSHNLCRSSENCENPHDLCPYIAEYDTDDTSSSGFLVQESLHLTSLNDDALRNRLQASVIMGCGRKQSGSFLTGAAPDGLMGLGPGSISVPSSLAKAGLIQNSFSICLGEDDSGRLLFGDQGPDSQQSTPFLTKDGNYDNYFVRVESYCVGRTCLKQSGFRALVDTGSSFTYLSNDIHDKVVSEFDKQLNLKRTNPQGGLNNCYNASSKDLVNFPTMKLMFAKNQTFSIGDYTISLQSGVVCLTLIPWNQDSGLIGQNAMTGHLMVFDRENLRLGWSHSKCRDPSDSTSVNISPPPGESSRSPLPTSEQQSKNNDTQARSPATVPVKASPKTSPASRLKLQPVQHVFYSLPLLVCLILTF